MRDYVSMFNQIVEIMRNDYGGKDEKIGWDNPEIFLDQIINLLTSNQLHDEGFYSIVDDYLSDFKDGHLIWLANGGPIKNCGFRVRRYKNSLYVIDVLTEESNVKKGWQIIEINGKNIELLGKDNIRKLKSDVLERQKWNSLISSANTVTFQLNNGEKLYYDVHNYKFKRRESKYEMKNLNDKILYMCFEDFANPDAILKLMTKNRKAMEQTPNWIIDVRNNGGGSDDAYYPLLPYLFSKGEKRKSEDLFYLMTERNCDTRVELLKAYSANWESKEDVEKYIKLMETNRGKGFVKIDSTLDSIMQSFNKTTVNPKHVIVITDTYCGSSGDQFIYDVKQASKVTVMGRPTAGVLDYSNLTSIKIDEVFQLMYPTSKMASVMKKQFTYNGIEPDIYIPWTPEHIEKDLDLEEALKILDRLNEIVV
ncbi:S41 family peptidase [Alkaliphilus transvaalensis]|uniref:S41 family peptidase n=1 Tax=Alkaliphilus transvaalensis TaxID=114628 RepID=UPI0004787655|nr:S41 family peptidase [Alkaliphilus transvaalensis]